MQKMRRHQLLKLVSEQGVDFHNSFHFQTLLSAEINSRNIIFPIQRMNFFVFIYKAEKTAITGRMRRNKKREKIEIQFFFQSLFVSNFLSLPLKLVSLLPQKIPIRDKTYRRNISKYEFKQKREYPFSRISQREFLPPS